MAPEVYLPEYALPQAAGIKIHNPVQSACEIGLCPGNPIQISYQRHGERERAASPISGDEIHKIVGNGSAIDNGSVIDNIIASLIRRVNVKKIITLF